ncbi:hypothetical protein TeGR_g6438 [Tetraparma gracilis]|uniref:Uncharacterized protein n=1 Tax=Tetraparma gracilis TaxID=2962635 RepID=A0ABQ6N6A6_9STRA|nr:hypothetical protein TeGR_g6438 [Tetraparma gracilis]
MASMSDLEAMLGKVSSNLASTKAAVAEFEAELSGLRAKRSALEQSAAAARKRAEEAPSDETEESGRFASLALEDFDAANAQALREYDVLAVQLKEAKELPEGAALEVQCSSPVETLPLAAEEAAEFASPDASVSMLTFVCVKDGATVYESASLDVEPMAQGRAAEDGSITVVTSVALVPPTEDGAEPEPELSPPLTIEVVTKYYVGTATRKAALMAAYERAGNARQKVVNAMRSLANRGVMEKNGEATARAGGGAAVPSGFLNKGAGEGGKKSVVGKVMGWFKPDGIVFAVAPRVKNFFIFALGVLAMHVYGDELKLPPPI